MEPFVKLTGRAAPLPSPNVDTGVIIRIERLTADDRAILGRYAFEALRYHPDGSENSDFVFNRPAFRNAPILIAGPNFGCGSRVRARSGRFKLWEFSASSPTVSETSAIAIVSKTVFCQSVFPRR